MNEFKPNSLYTVRYIAISGGIQTAIDVLGKDLPWFVEHSIKVISITEQKGK